MFALRMFALRMFTLVVRSYVLQQTGVRGCVRFHEYACSRYAQCTLQTATSSPITVRRCQVCVWSLQFGRSVCCWLASPFSTVSCRPSAFLVYQDGVLRLRKEGNSLVPLPGEDIRPDHPLPGQRRAHNNEGWRLQVYPSLQKDRDNLVKSELKHTKRTFWITKS